MDVLQELKETIADIRDWDGAAMKAWDQSRELIEKGYKSDFPRLIYENTISSYMETMIKAADEIERLRKVVTLLIEYEEHDENIYKGAVMWEALIEAAHRALMEKQS